jgi:hypothetical protein
MLASGRDMAEYLVLTANAFTSINKEIKNKGDRNMVSKVQLMRDFFSTPNKPITTKELIDFAKTDRAGYDKLAQEVADATGQKLDEPK